MSHTSRKYGARLQFVDDFELVRQARKHFGAQRAVAFAGALETELPQIGEGRFARRHGEFREDELAEFELQVAALGNLQRGAQELRVIGKEALHFGGGLEPGAVATFSPTTSAWIGSSRPPRSTSTARPIRAGRPKSANWSRAARTVRPLKSTSSTIQACRPSRATGSSVGPISGRGPTTSRSSR